MQRTTTLTTLIGIAVASLAPGLVASPARAAETCDGKAATIVAVLPAGTHVSAPVGGTPGDDVIVGTDGDDTIDGAGGNDTICGLAGRDQVLGGEGDDRLFGGLDGEYVPDDGYHGDRVAPGPGNDHVDLGHDPTSTDLWWGDTGLWDQVSYADAAGPVIVDLAAGIATGEGTDTIARVTFGGGIEGSRFEDQLTGQAGPDWITGGGGDDTIVGGDGNDRIDADQLSLIRQEPADSSGDDVVDGGGGADTVFGGYGADVLSGGSGNDTVRALAGKGSRVLGGPGDDEVAGSGRVRLEGQEGRDTLWPDVDGPGVIRAEGGPGRDQLLLDVSRRVPGDTRLVIGRPRGTVRIAGETVVRFSSTRELRLNSLRPDHVTWWGTPGGDEADLENSNKSVRAFGRGGNDVIRGSWEGDLLDGGPGRDVLDGSAGRDRCLGGERLLSCEARR